MKEIIRYGFVLAIICIVASGLLAGMNALTKSRIIAQAQAEEEASLKDVIPEGEYFQPVKSGEEIIYYKARDEKGRLVGVAFKAQGKGYSSTIETMVGMSEEGKVTTIKILSHNETPGLGAQVIEPSFTNQFKNLAIEDLANVQAISGATISSRAVMDSVKNKAEEITKLIENEK